MSETGPQRRFPWWVYWIALAFIAIFALWPLASVIATATIANANGCRVDEGSVHPCMVGGQDIGETLYTMGVAGWLLLVTLPLGFGAAIVWLITLLIHRSAWGRRNRPPARLE